MKWGKSNTEKGQWGEQHAELFLINNGFKILEKNWRHHHLEIDIIASKDCLLHIIEVKSRQSLKFGMPEESIKKKKMQFLKNAAEAYQFKHPIWKQIQFDVITIILNSNDFIDINMIEDVYF